MDDSDIKKLTQRLEEAQQRDTQPKENRAGSGLHMGVDLASAFIVGVVIGLLIDKYFQTAPWGIVVMTIIGFAAGFLNIYKTLSGQGYSIGFHRKEKK